MKTLSHVGPALRIGVLALLWGSGFLWIKLAIYGLSPTQVTLARLVLGAGFLAAILHGKGLRLPRGKALWTHLIVAALFANSAPYLLFTIAEQTVSSSVAGAINATTPLWTLVAAFISRQDTSVTAARVTGLAIGFVGALLIFSPWESDGALASWGGLICLAAAISYAISYVYMARFLSSENEQPIVLSAGQLIAASGLTFFALPFGGLEPITPHASVIVAIFVLGVLGTGIAYVLNYQIIRDDGPVLASTVTYLLPVVAIFLGWAALGEEITGPSLGGTAIVLLGVAVTRLVPQRTKETQK
ncbi:DMT family transporter [Nonomuraea sp. NPDC004702]